MSKRFKAGTGFGSRARPIVIDASPARPRKTRVVAITTKAPRRQGITPSLSRQLKALISAKKRDAADVSRSVTNIAAGTASGCLTSTSPMTATAPSGSGLLDADADEIMINHVRIKGVIDNKAIVDVDGTGQTDVFVRLLVVWFNKPLQVAVPAGSLPPITEVLVTDSLYSLPVTDAANGGRFKILSDKKFRLGQNTIISSTNPGGRQTGSTSSLVDYTVRVNKMCKFKESAQSGASTAGGHYDSDVAPGQLDRGILVLYQMATNGGGEYTPSSTLTSRLNYTG